MERFWAGAVQFDPRSGEPAENLRRALALLESSPRADLFLLPELFTTGYRLSSALELAKKGEETLLGLTRWAKERETALSGSILLPSKAAPRTPGFSSTATVPSTISTARPTSSPRWGRTGS